VAEVVVGVVLTAVFGGLLVPAVTSCVDRRRSRRRVQAQCVRKATSLAGSFYAATLTAKRQVEWPEVYGVLDTAALTEVYHESTSQWKLFEQELRFLYGSDTGPYERWHQVYDLLTARYLHVLDMGTPENFKYMWNRSPDGDLHSGLSVDELQNPTLVDDTYANTLYDLIDLLTQNKPRV
jgi:hypothetical protein